MATSAEYNLGEYAFPRGWFVVANSAQILPGKPFNARYFGEDVVIFRTAEGEVGMLGAYCPHMGTHFGTSTTAYIANAARFAEIGAAELIAATPIDDGSCRIWQGAMVRAPGGVVNDEARAFARQINDMFGAGLGVHDGEIWATKRPATRILQLPTDGPFGQARIWYSQFFNPRSMADRIVSRVTGVHRVKGVPGAPQDVA